MFSTSGGYHEYIGGTPLLHRGIPWVHREISWVHRGYHDACGGYHEYVGGCAVHQGDTMSTVGGYHEYIGGYYEYIGGCWVHWRMFSTSGFSIEIERFLPTWSPMSWTHIIQSAYGSFPVIRTTSFTCGLLLVWYDYDLVKTVSRSLSLLHRFTGYRFGRKHRFHRERYF